MKPRKFASKAEQELQQYQFLFEPEPWTSEAACKECPDPDRIFFPKGEKLNSRSYEQAKWYCARCPVRLECLEYALRTRQTEGMWGGWTPSDRRRKCNTFRRLAAQ